MDRFKILLLIPLMLNLPAIANENSDASPITRLAFGSCNKQTKSQKYWTTIEKADPDLFMWLGDNIYGDTKDMDVLKQKYQTQYNNPYYQSFRRKFPIIGTWDDHDYGQNNAGKNYAKKQESQKLFMDFIGEPKSSPRRNQAGVYTSYSLGSGEQSIKVLLLDTRYHRDRPGRRGDILGKVQWEWLERELTDSPAKIHLIVSSVSVLSKDIPFTEGWANFPSSKRKLADMLNRLSPSGVLFMSGDRHFAGFIRSKLGDKVYMEVMSSGLTHSSKNLAKSVLQTAYGKKNAYFGTNFGILDFHWKARGTQVVFNAVTPNNKIGLSKTFILKNRHFQLIE